MDHIAFFDGAHKERVERHIAIERAMSSKSFFSQLSILYQPIVHMPTRRTIGYEGLVRWNHSELGAISPCEFIGTAEENGMILDIGAFVIDKAVSTARRLREQARTDSTRTDMPFVSINVSPVQLLEDGLPEYILNKLDKAGLPVSSIKLEITETSIDESHETFRRATEAFARASSMMAIAEGIETYAHAKMVMDAGCIIGQGYLFGKPAPVTGALHG